MRTIKIKNTPFQLDLGKTQIKGVTDIELNDDKVLELLEFLRQEFLKNSTPDCPNVHKFDRIDIDDQNRLVGIKTCHTTHEFEDRRIIGPAPKYMLDINDAFEAVIKAQKIEAIGASVINKTL